jgi:aryl-alcohol dehydrogenase-like predicted oxidoreductase
MEYRKLGRSGLSVSPIVLGAMMFADRTDEAEAGRIVAAARDAGVNTIDTADAYSRGASEAMVGRLVAGDRARWVVATKLANPTSDAPNDAGTSRRHLVAACEASLKRLGTDWIDLYWLHRDDAATPQEETVAGLEQLTRDGKIRYWGVSNFHGWRIARIAAIARAMGAPPPIAAQPLYNAVSRVAEVEVLPACASEGLGVLPYSPLARGVLTGKYAPDAAPPEGSRAARGDKRIHETEWRPESLQVAQRIAQHAASRGLSTVQFALAWVLNNALVTGVIAGPRTLEQWQAYLSAPLALSADDEAFVDALVSPGHASTHRWTDPQYPVRGRVAR